MAIDKYLDHLPLERQARILERHGLRVTSQTRWDQIDALARRLEPSHQALLPRVLASPLVGTDETRWQLMERGGGSSRGPTAGLTSAGNSSRSKRATRSRPRRPSTGLASCTASSGKCPERFTRSPRNRCACARSCAPSDRGPSSTKLRTWAEQLRPSLLPRSGLGQAISYMLDMWPGLVRFLDDPRIPLDYIATERALRGGGRENHYGSRSKRGTEVAALFYSLCETAKLAGVDPRSYLLEATRRALAEPGTATLPHSLLS